MKQQPAFGKISRDENLSRKIERQIIEAIQQKIYLPKEKLPGEIELAKSFGVSRTAVREALHILAGKGYVETRKGSGVYISDLNYTMVTDPFIYLLDMKCGDASLEQIAQVRLVIEPEIARLAAENRTEDDINFWMLNVQSMKNSTTDKMILHDVNFHRRGAEATGNPVIPIMMEPIYHILYRFISETYTEMHSPKLAVKNHVLLLKAYREKDGNQAFKIMKKHMQEAMAHAVSITRSERKKKPSRLQVLPDNM